MFWLARLKAPGGVEPRNSVFPVGEGGVFERVCAIRTRKTPGELDTGPWRWYAMPISDREFHALVLPQPQAPPGSLLRDLTIISAWPEAGHAVALVTHETPAQILHTLCKYAPDSNRWTPLPPMNTPDREPLSLAGAAIGDSLYVAGGQTTERGGRGSPISAAERFDLRTDRWESLPSMRYGRSFAKGFALDGRFFVVHNSLMRSPIDGSAEIFDPATNRWEFVPRFLPGEARRFSLAILRNELYLVMWSSRSHRGTLLRYDKHSSAHDWIFVDEVPCKKGDSCPAYKQLVAVGSELWVIDTRGPVIPAAKIPVADRNNYYYCEMMYRFDQVSCGTSVWPIFAGPSYWPNEDSQINRDAKTAIYACKIDNAGAEVSPTWRTIPIFGQ